MITKIEGFGEIQARQTRPYQATEHGLRVEELDQSTDLRRHTPVIISVAKWNIFDRPLSMKAQLTGLVIPIHTGPSAIVRIGGQRFRQDLGRQSESSAVPVS